MSEIERFFDERSAPVFHEVSPLAASEVVDELVERGYRPLEFTSVMYLPLGGEPTTDGVRAVERFEVRAISEGEGPLWADVSVRGWSAEHPEYEEYLRELAPISTGRRGAISVLAFLDGEPVAAGSMSLHDGVLLLAGACTVPEARRLGAQRALLRYRLAYARDNGCDVAMMCAQPGSASQRNAERQGFRIAYTRIKWGRSELA